MATAEVKYGSILERNAWVIEKLNELKSQSFCAPYIGNTFSSVVQQVTDISKKDGHEVRFQYDGNLISAPVEGSDTAFGKGESKKLFSDSVRVRRYRFPVDNGDKFNGVDIGATYLTEHQHSMDLLGDKWIRFKDQAILDVAQQSATHRIVVDDKLDLSTMGKIQTILASGMGYSKMNSRDEAPRRRPLAPYKLANGEYVYLFLVDSFIAQKFLKDSQSVLSVADVRGADNMLIKGVRGRIHNLLIVEAPIFFGESRNSKTAGDFVSADGYSRLGSTDIEVAGLRQFFSADGNTINSWSGQVGLGNRGAQQMWSRGVILGAGAIHYANGLEPKYSVQYSQDFAITSQSCLETWVGFRAVKLLDENGDYPTKMAGVSHGIVAVDIKIEDNATPFMMGRMGDGIPYIDGSPVMARSSDLGSIEAAIEAAKQEAAAEYQAEINKLKAKLEKAKAQAKAAAKGTDTDSSESTDS